MMRLLSRIRRIVSAAFAREAPTPGPQPPTHRAIRARYDAAQTTDDNRRHWGAADGLDADSANSLAVRRALVYRSRYEVGNNGHGKGTTLTQANYVVGRGPSLRMQTASPAFNAMVEAAWKTWAKRVLLARKLRTAVKAKVADGEAFLIARRNPNLRDRVQLDLTAIECEQCSTPFLPFAERYRIDGIQFDEFGNPTFYDILPQHPGSTWWTPMTQEAERVPAKFVLHLFRDDRAGQHRGVPENTSVLNLYARGRRFREAVIAAAEAAADINLVMKTQQAAEPDPVAAGSTIELEKGMLTALPAGYDLAQAEARQPATTYEMFNRSMICEQARPLNMPYNIAACDSSGYSFSGGKLDHLTYFTSVDVEQQDIEDLILDPLFELWFAEAVFVYGWAGGNAAPPHTWDWPARPQIDEVKTANARKTSLSTGAMSLRRIYAEDGFDFEDELAAMAEDYGVSVAELRAKLYETNFQRPGAAPSASPANQGDESPPAFARARNGRSRIPSP